MMSLSMLKEHQYVSKILIRMSGQNIDRFKNIEKQKQNSHVKWLVDLYLAAKINKKAHTYLSDRLIEVFFT